MRLDEVVLRALEKEPERRYQQASEIKTQVESIVTTPSGAGAAGFASVSPHVFGVPLVRDRDGKRIVHWPGVWLSVTLLIIGGLIVESLLSANSFYWFASPGPSGRLEPGPLLKVCLTFLVYALLFGWAMGFIMLIVKVREGLATPTERPTPLDGPKPHESMSSDGDDAAIEQARRQVKGPAIGLLITGILNLLVALPASAIFGPILAAGDASKPTVWHSPPRLLEILPSVVFLLVIFLVPLVLSGMMIFAALKMKRLQAYGLAVTCSILAMLSPAFFVGVPIGIWALMALSQRDVRNAFRQNGRKEGGRPWKRWTAISVVLVAVIVWLTIYANGKRPYNPSDVQGLSDAELLQRLPRQVEEPWVWRELEKRLGSRSLTKKEVNEAVKILIAHMTTKRPNGWDQPLTWFDGFLSNATRAGMISSPVLLELCGAVYGPKPTIDLPRWREDKPNLPITINYGSTWDTTNQKVLGVALLWQIEQFLLDGKPIKVQGTRAFDWYWVGNYPDKLKAGEHELKVNVNCAYVDQGKMIGLTAKDLPKEMWPEARKRWTQTVSAPLRVYAPGEAVVALVTDASRSPGPNGGIQIKRLVAQAGGGEQKKIVLKVDFDSKPSKIALSYDVAIILPGRTAPVPLGSLWIVRREDGSTTSSSDLLEMTVAHIAPSVRQAEIVLTPNPSHVDQFSNVTEIWGKKVTIAAPLERLDVEGKTASFAPYKARLPNGTTVELLGVSDNPSQGRPWWRPDGSPLPERPYDWLGASVVAGKESVAREFAVRLENVAQNQANIQFDIKPSLKSSTRDWPGLAGPAPNVHGVAVEIPASVETATVRVGVADGIWQTVAESQGAAVT